MTTRLGELRLRLNSRFGFREFTTWEWRGLVGLAVLQALDVVVTYYVLTYFSSTREVNPVARLLIDNGIIWLGLVKFAVVLWIAHKRSREPRSRPWQMWVVASFYLVVVAWNVTRILLLLDIFV